MDILVFYHTRLANNVEVYISTFVFHHISGVICEWFSRVVLYRAVGLHFNTTRFHVARNDEVTAATPPSHRVSTDMYSNADTQHSP